MPARGSHAKIQIDIIPHARVTSGALQAAETTVAAALFPGLMTTRVATPITATTTITSVMA
jgi:hypothetical protein